MNNCEYSYYDVFSNGRNYLYCSINNKICPLVKFCQTEGKIVNTHGQYKCKIKLEKEDNMQKGKYKVKLHEKGFLYIDITEIGQTIKIKNPLDVVPKYVNLIEIDKVYYIEGFEPKIEPKIVGKEVEKKETNKNKKK